MIPAHFKGSTYGNLLWEMTRCEFKLRDQGTLLGFFWTLLNPALVFTVMYQLFTKWMGQHVPNYAFYLIIGLVQWGFVANATSNALRSLQSKGGILKNFKFPKEIVVLSAIAVILWSHLLELLILLGFLLFFIGAAWTWVYLPVLIVIELLWVAGVSFFLARLALKYRDMERIWAIVMQVGFFAVPVFYPLQLIAENKRFWLMLNPIVHIMDGMRACLLRSQVPPPWIVTGLILGGVLMSAAGLRWFRAQEGTIVDHL